MTVRECYEKLHGDYDEALQRLMNDGLVEKFMLKFLNDTSMAMLRNGVAHNDIEESFRGAHTLKGVAANLAFKELQENASLLTEQLRSLTKPADSVLLEKVEESYNLAMETLKAYQTEND